MNTFHWSRKICLLFLVIMNFIVVALLLLNPGNAEPILGKYTLFLHKLIFS